jgi:hypothetical protein
MNPMQKQLSLNRVSSSSTFLSFLLIGTAALISITALGQSPQSAVVILSDLSHVYDGSPKLATVQTEPVGLAVLVTYDGSAEAPINAGTYTVEAVVDDPNYEGTATGNLVVTKAAASVVLGDLEAVFDGEPKAVSVITDPVGLAVLVTYDGSAEAPVNAGTYTVEAVVDDPNYEGTATGDLVIAKAAASVVLGDLEAVFDGEPKAASVTTEPVGLAVLVTYDGSAEAPVTAGTYTVEAVVDDPNYEGTAAGNSVIAKAAASVVLGDLEAVFDGEPKAASVTTEPVGLAVLVTYDGSAEAPVNAGAYAVEAVVDDPNYEGTAAGNLVIAKAAASVVLGDLEAVFDGEPKVASVTTEPVGLAVLVTYGGSAEPPINAGAYAVEAVVDDPNYEGTAAGNLVIAKATASVVLGDLEAVFDGEPKAASVTTEPSGLAVLVTYDGSAEAPVNAGTYTVEALVDDPNYEGTATGNLVIAKATATVALADLDAVYDGQPQAVSFTTTPEDLTVLVTYNGSSDPPVAAGAYEVEAVITDPNYSGSTSGILTISQAPAVVILGNLEAAYDGAPKFASITTEPASLAVTVTYDGSPDAPINLGSYEVEAVVTEVNYTGSASGTLVIGKGVAVVTLSGLEATYDGTAKSVGVVSDPAGLAVLVTYDGSDAAPIDAGSYAVAATIDDSLYTGSASGTLVIAQAGQSIVFDPIPDQELGADPIPLIATASSGLAVEFTVISGPATIVEGDLIVTGIGRVVVRASQGGDANWAAAGPVENVFQVMAADFLQDFLWVRGFGGAGFEDARSVAVDSAGNVYVAFDFDGTLNIGGVVLTAEGTSIDLGLIKLSPGGAVIWAKRFGGANSDLAKAVAVDAGDNILFAGEFITSTTIDGTVHPTAGSRDIVLVKVDPQGAVLWSRTYGGSSADFVHAMALDGEGNIHLAGAFSGTISFGGTALVSRGGQDGFVAKLDADGNAVWAINLGGTSNDIAYAVAVAENGDVLVGGSFAGGATFGSFTRTSAGGTDGFVALLSSGGVVQWAIRVGGTTSDGVRAVAFDAGGAAYATGSFTGGAAEFGTQTLSSAGQEDGFVARFSAEDGTVLNAVRFGGASSVVGLGLAADPFGGLHVSGSFQGAAFFGDHTLNSKGLSDAFVAKVRPSGSFAWVLAGGGTEDDRAPGIVVSAGGEVLLTGIFGATATFGTHSITGGGFWDIFVAKVNGPRPAFTAQPAAILVDAGDPFQISAPAVGAEPISYQWFRNGDELTGETGPELSVGSAIVGDAGDYHLVATNPYGSATLAPVPVSVRVPDRVLSMAGPSVTEENRIIEAPLFLDSDGEVTALTVELSFDTDFLREAEFVPGPALADSSSSVTVNEQDGLVRVVGNAFPSSIPAGQQLAGTFRFRTRSVPADASIFFQPRLISSSDVLGQPLAGYTKLIGGNVSIQQRSIPGDANNNGRLDVADAAELLRLYANPSQIRPWDHPLNDLNLDGILTEADVTRVLRVVAFLDPTPSFPEPPSAGFAAMSFGTVENEVEAPILTALTSSQAPALRPSSASSLVHAMSFSGGPSSRLVLTRLTGAAAGKVLAQVYLDGVEGAQSGLSFRVEYPAALLRIAGSGSLIVPGGGLPSGASVVWNVAPGHNFAQQSGTVYFASSWSGSWTYSADQPVANIVFDLLIDGNDVHFLMTLAGVESAPNAIDGVVNPQSIPAFTALFSRTSAQWEMRAEGFVVRWQGQLGVEYRVVTSTNLRDWTELPGSRITGADREVEVTDSFESARRFYRIEVLPPPLP